MEKATDGLSQYALSIRLEGLPPTLNKLNGMHHMAEARLNKRWRDAVMWAAGSNIPKQPLERARIKITRHSSVEGDGDNYSGGYKGIVDAFRYLKILADDRVSNIGNIETLWIKERPGKGFIEVEIREL